MSMPTISYRLLDSTPVTETTDTVRVQVSCEPPYRGFTHVVMQFDVPSVVTVPADPSRKGKKKGSVEAAPVIVSDARDKAIRDRVLWKAKQELGAVAKHLTESDVIDEAA